ncbi:MAG: amidohydrolase family protein [Candidatus Limnocylindrales bacterium]
MLSLPVIDAHQHFWDPGLHAALGPPGPPAPLDRAYEAADLVPELELEHVTGSVLVGLLHATDETRRLLAMARSVPFVHGVVGWVDLTAAHVAGDIERLRSGPGGELLVGLSHRAHDEPDAGWLLRDDVRRGIAAVGAADLAFDLQVTTRELPAAYELCAAHPGMRFVLDHLGRPPIASGDLSAWGRALLPLAELPNVSAKISGLVTEADWLTWSIDDLRDPVELAIDAFGARRLMLGSDWPICLLAGSYTDVIDSARYLLAELPVHLQDEIRGGTAVRVYRLGRPIDQRRPTEGDDQRRPLEGDDTPARA